MSDLEKTVSIIFSGIDKTGNVISGISKNVDQFSSKIESVAQPLASMADGVLKVDAALATLAATGMAIAIVEAGKFGDSFNEISTLTDAVGKDLGQFKGDILDYSRDSTASIDAINASIYTAISAGADYKDSLDILKISEQLSVAGKSDLNETTKVLVSSLNAYGASTDAAASYSDALFKTVKLGQTTMPELAASLAQVSTTAANSGVSFDELMASIAAVTATGAPTSQAITAIKAAISAIVKPTAEAATEAGKLGIEFNASALATKGLDGVLKDVYTATGGATSEIVKLFGSVESLPAVMTLGKDASGKFAATLEEFANKAGATAEAYSKMADNFSLTNQNLANNVKVTFIQVGSELVGSYAGIVGEITDLFKGIGEGVDAGAFDALFRAINDAGSEITKFLDELGNSIPEALEQIDWTELIDALEELGGSFGSMFDGFDPSDPQSVADAIQFVVDSVESLITITKGMVDSFAPFIEGLLNSAEAFNGLNDADKEAAGNLLGIAEVIVTLGTEITAFLMLLGDSAEKIEIFFDTVIGSIEMLWGGFKVTIQAVTAAVLLAIDGILEGLELVTWGDWNDKVKAMRSGIALELSELETRFNLSVKEVNDGLSKITDHIDPPDVTPKIDAPAFQSDVDKINEIVERMKNGTYEMPITLKAQQDEFDAIVDKIENSEFNIDFTTNADEIQSDFEGITDEINQSIGNSSSIEFPFAIMYNWTDSAGGAHYSDKPPDPNDAIGGVEEIKVPISPAVKAEDKNKALKEVDDIKTEVEEKLSKFEMAMAVEAKIETNFDQVNDALAISEKAYEAYAGTVEAAYTSGAEIIAGASSAIASLASTFTQAAGLDKYKVEDWTNQQIKLQDREMDLREKLANQNEKHLQRQEQQIEDQIRALDNHRYALEDYVSAMEGERTITLQMDGVEPEIEMVMWKILKAIQVRANESGAEFLLAAAGA